MSMRITNKMLSNNFLNDMRINLNGMQSLQSKLASGKEIRKPSDNPFKVARSLQLRSSIDANKQYNENITNTINWLDATDTSLDQLSNSMQRVRELMISSGNAAYGSDELNAINDELNQKVDEISQILNSSFDGKYIFGGSNTTSKPTGTIEVNGNKVMELKGSDGVAVQNMSSAEGKKLEDALTVEISQGVNMEYNIKASSVLNFTTTNGRAIDLKQTLKDITTNLSSQNPQDREKVINENLEDITQGISNLLKIRAEVGSKQNRMDSAKSKNEDENFNLTEIMSKNEDIDFTEKTMEYSTAQTVYMAALQTSAKILQPTLMDFLR